MKACVNPKLIDGVPLSVINPRTKRPFPQGEVFDLSPDDIKHAGVRRLFPKSEPGGSYGDLLHGDNMPKSIKDDLAVVAQLVAEPKPASEAKPVDAKADKKDS